MPDFTELKQRHREMWASGDYDRTAAGIQAVAGHVVRSARIRPGERVLDVACGTGKHGADGPGAALDVNTQANKQRQAWRHLSEALAAYRDGNDQTLDTVRKA